MNINATSPVAEQVQHMDNADLWKRAASVAASMGALHASLGVKPLKEDSVVTALYNTLGRFGYRRFHSRLLRVAYGAGYLGVKKSQECKARGI